MFTGIVIAIGKVAAIAQSGAGTRVRIDTADMGLADVQAGDSLCVSGVCLTVVSLDSRSILADLSPETLSLTCMDTLTVGTRVNLEKALTLSTRLGGHLVTGHVDGIARIGARVQHNECTSMTLEVPDELTKYISRKGSLCVDGVSLTVNSIAGTQIGLQLIPFTLSGSTLGGRVVGDKVNIEVDILARYLEGLMRGDGGHTGQGGITLEKLRRGGTIATEE